MNTPRFINPSFLPEIELRVSSIASHIREAGMKAILVASNANIFYTSGRYFRGYTYITDDGRAYWLVIRPEGFAPQENMAYIRKPEQIVEALAAMGATVPAAVGLEIDVLPYSTVERLSKALSISEIKDGSAPLRKARMVKTAYEIEEMRKDGMHQTEAYRHIPGIYRLDMTDVEFQIEIERLLRREGALGFSRVAGNLMEINMGSVLAGDNADNPTPYDFSMGGAGTDPSLPVGADGSIMRPGTAVMVDMNGAFNGYQTDLTRVWSIGRLPDLAMKAHDCSIRIMRELEKIALPGEKVSALYERAKEIVEEEKLTDYFMGHLQKAPFIGHGVGIELNEMPVLTPRSRDILEENMTIAIEPKFVIPGVGAVGIENTYRVTKDGLENLTPCPESVEEL